MISSLFVAFFTLLTFFCIESNWTSESELSQYKMQGFEGQIIAISSDGTTLASLINTTNDNSAIEIYIQSNSSWVHQSTITTNSATNYMLLALSLDGNILAVGCPNYQQGTGLTYIYKRTGASWNLQNTLSQQIPNSNEGISVALSADGNTLACGASGLNSFAGATHIYVQINDTWQYQATLSQQVSGATEGQAVALSADGNTCAVGAPNEGGVTYIYKRTGTQWQHIASLTQSAFKAEGLSVSLSGDGTLIAAGDPYFKQSGATQVYGFSQNVWTFLITLSQLNARSLEAYSVSMSSNGIIIAAGCPGFNNNTGATQIYIKSGNSWIHQISLSQNSFSSEEGKSIALSGNGSLLAAGAPYANKTIGGTFIYKNE